MKGFPKQKIIGVVGGQGVGKSTILGMLGQKRVDDNTFLGYSGTAGNIVKLGTGQRAHRQRFQDVIFPVQTEDCALNATFQTSGIDMHVTDEGLVLMDTQPILSPAVLDQLFSKDQEANFPNFIISPVHYVEYTSLLLVLFLYSVCHVVVVVQDWMADHNVLKLLKTAEMILPSMGGGEHRSRASDIVDDGGCKESCVVEFPHTVFIYNQTPSELFSLETLQSICLTHETYFKNTRIIGDVSVVNMRDLPGPLISGRYLDCNLTAFEGKNIFLLPIYRLKPSRNSVDNSFDGGPIQISGDDLPLNKDFDSLFSELKSQLVSAAFLTVRDVIEQDW